MNRFATRAAVTIAIGAAALALPALASPVVNLDALRTWNLVVLGDLTSSSEVEGRTFVGGDLNGNSSNYQIGTPAPSDAVMAGLIVVGNVNGGTKNLNNGAGALVGGNVTSGFNLNGPAQTVKVGGTIANTNVNQNKVVSNLGQSDPGFVAGLQQQKALLAGSLTDLSGELGALKANSAVTIAGNRATFNAVPDAQGVAVFALSADQLKQFGEVQLNLNGADTAIVNVSGSTIALDDNFLGGTANLGEHVIWNFAQAETLNLSTAWGGSILAPKANATTGNYIQGSAVFGNLVQNGEMHLGTYRGGYTPPKPTPGGPTPVPEPAPLMLFLLGGGGLALAAQLRRRRARAGVARG